MPAVLGVGESANRDAADITIFLLRQRDSAAKQSSTNQAPTTERPVDGDSLYESLGCIACHYFEPHSENDDFERLSLYYASAKYRRGALSAFLRKPTAHYMASRMPHFRLSAAEANALATFVRSESNGKFSGTLPVGEAVRGQRLFTQKGCQQCHGIGEKQSIRQPHLAWKHSSAQRGCLADDVSPHRLDAPHFAFSRDQRRALRAFLQHDLDSLGRANAVETSTRLIQRLQCASCHDRDGQRSHRPLVIAEEGSGRFPEVLPALTWAGEKFRPSWTETLLAGNLHYKSRPWTEARMPAYPKYAAKLAHGLAAEHAIDPQEQPSHSYDADLAGIGGKLTLQSGLDCRQCHAIGDLKPRGDKDTDIAVGINFAYIRDRLRRDAYQRFMLNPPRYDVNTKMIRLSEDGLTTKLREYFDADAHQQFGALWHFIQSLPEPSE